MVVLKGIRKKLAGATIIRIRKERKIMNIMILVNKDFEYAGYRAGVDSRIRANAASNLNEIAYDTGIGPDKLHMSRMYKLGVNTVREYCICYLFPAGANTSNSEMKYSLVRNLIKQEAEKNFIDLIISVSTGESTPAVEDEYKTVNGCVYIGHKFFVRDCRDCDQNTTSYLKVDNQYYKGLVDNKIFDLITSKKVQIEAGMKTTPRTPNPKPFVCADKDIVSLGVVNVVNYSAYGDADPTTYKEYIAKGQVGLPVCLETTHVVVKMAEDAVMGDRTPVLFVTPIVDRYEHFNDDVDDKWGHQNLTSSYNAGVVVANILENVINELY
ncbi:MAG: hypothetical protein IKH20_00490 [Clostridiales bacterium]|nr:hypothetical protein [Clostridiales bacterium]